MYHKGLKADQQAKANNKTKKKQKRNTKRKFRCLPLQPSGGFAFFRFVMKMSPKNHHNMPMMLIITLVSIMLIHILRYSECYMWTGKEELGGFLDQLSFSTGENDLDDGENDLDLEHVERDEDGEDD